MANPVADFTEREEALIALVTGRFPERSLEARIVSVNKLEGGQAETLRLTLDDVSSTDLERSRVEQGSQTLEMLADEVAAELESPATGIGP